MIGILGAIADVLGRAYVLAIQYIWKWCVGEYASLLRSAVSGLLGFFGFRRSWVLQPVS